MTKEDYWPRWYQKFNERRWKKAVHITSRPDDAGDVVIKQRLRPGDPTESKLGRVCGECNNGWMSDLQNAAKPLITELLSGKWRDFSSDEQETLAAWATMFTMVVEYKDPATVAISQEHRSEFCKSRKPPKLFKIWMGRLLPGTRHHGSFYHQALAAFLEGEPKPNIQTNVISFDGLLFLVASARRDYVFVERTDNGEKFHFHDIAPDEWLGLGLGQLWPIQVQRLAPPERPLDDTDYNLLVHFLAHFANTGPRAPLLLSYDPDLPDGPIKAPSAAQP
ncbi:hypothetical protein [Bradyrhizobium sp. USDA 329]|uniref:hypothetical protein n=1 Tax=unclassified Bradyrhizobium TaxID=2631580 RepID=UPI003519C8DD